MTRNELRNNAKKNLADNGQAFYTDVEYNESLQDAYDDIAILTQCIIKTVTLDWISDLTYYDFRSIGVSDYLATICILNNVTKWYLRDDLNLRDFDRIRRDWENWNGTPQFWAPCSSDRIAICAKYIGVNLKGAFSITGFGPAFYIGSQAVLGTFTLTYAAEAPVFTSDADVPLIATDMQTLFEHYVTADLLEQAQEFVKAAEYWSKYYENIAEYKERVHKFCKTDVLLRV